jgi:PHD/YefM family antitoxin component YafN of YafNO toxin-antitoxin module
MTLHPQIIEKEGKKEYVILPYEEFVFIQDELDDFTDLKELRAEKERSKDEPTKKLDEIIKDIEPKGVSRKA